MLRRINAELTEGQPSVPCRSPPGPRGMVTSVEGERQRMSNAERNDKPKQQIRQLRELITALDSRVPRIERTGETTIAADAEALKEKALKRLAELQADGEQ